MSYLKVIGVPPNQYQDIFQQGELRRRTHNSSLAIDCGFRPALEGFSPSSRELVIVQPNVTTISHMHTVLFTISELVKKAVKSVKDYLESPEFNRNYYLFGGGPF